MGTEFKEIDLLEFFEKNKGALAAFSLFFIFSVYLQNNLLKGMESEPYYQYLKILPFVSFVLFLLIGVSLINRFQNITNKSPIMGWFMVVFALFVLGLSLLFLKIYLDITLAIYAIAILFGVPTLAVFLAGKYIFKKKEWVGNVILSIPFLLTAVGFDVSNIIINVAREKTLEVPILGEQIFTLVIGLVFALLLVSFGSFLHIVNWALDRLFGTGQKFWSKIFESGG